MVQPELRVAGRSHVGRVRDHNEDTAGISELDAGGRHFLLWLVADGMGGLARGEVASAIARDALTAALQDTKTWDDPGARLAESMREANAAVYSAGTAHGELSRSGMGTTLVAALVDAETGDYWIANIGDSRAYRIRGRTLEQVTNDHSFIAEQVSAGIITTEEAQTASHRNIITRAVGTDAVVEADVFGPFRFQRGELILLCSDGLHGMIDDAAIVNAVGALPIEDAAQALIAAANAAGGRDNITAILGGWPAAPGEADATVSETATPIVVQPAASTGGGAGKWIALAAIVLVMLGAGAAFLLLRSGDGTSDNRYTVLNGQTCAQAAAANGVSEAELRAANAARIGDGQPCEAGMKLLIPEPQAASATDLPATVSPSPTAAGLSQDTPTPAARNTPGGSLGPN